jgi:hypothetical protein
MSLAVMSDNDSSTALKIEKLHGSSNWTTWKFDIKLHLVSRGLWDVVNPTVPLQTSIDAVIQSRLDKSFAVIGLMVDPSQKLYILDATDGRAAWQALVDVYDSHDPSTQLVRRTAFFEMRMSSEESVNIWLARVKAEATQLRGIGSTVDNRDVVSVMLIGLTPAYHHVRSSLLTAAARDGTELTISAVEKALLAESALVAASAGPTTHTALAAQPSHSGSAQHKQYHGSQRDRSDDVCRWCAKKGHWEENCRSKASGKPRVSNQKLVAALSRTLQPKASGGKGRKGRQADSSSSANAPVSFTAIAQPTALRASSSLHTYLDSGANVHIFAKRSAFIEYSSIHQTGIRLATKDTNAFAIGKGTVRFVSRTESKEEVITLSDAFHVPMAEANLISVGALIRKNATISFTNAGAMRVHLGERLAISVPLDNGLWAVPARFDASPTPPSAPRAFFGSNKPASLELWHERLGHLSTKAISELSKSVDGLRMHGTDSGGVCGACQQGKGHRDPFPQSDSRASRPFELLHADITGPIQPPTRSGARYISVVIDDHSNALFVDVIEHKSSAFDHIKGIVDFAKARGMPVLALRTDNDPCYGAGPSGSTAAKQYWIHHGIQHQTTVPYTPSSNGKSERGVKAVKEGVATLLAATRSTLEIRDVDSRLWGEAVRTVAYLHNRRLHTSTGDKTPYELVFRRRPHLAHLRIFGSYAWVHTAKEKRSSAFSPHRRLLIFVGYSLTSKAWRFYDPATSRITEAREAAFLESSRTEQYSDGENNDGCLLPLADAEPNEDQEMGAASESSPAARFGPASPTSPAAAGGGAVRAVPTHSTLEGFQTAPQTPADTLATSLADSPAAGQDESPAPQPNRRGRWADLPRRTQPRRDPSNLGSTIAGIRFADSTPGPDKPERPSCTLPSMAGALHAEGGYASSGTIDASHVDRLESPGITAFHSASLVQDVPKSFEEAMASSEAEHWLEACTAELSSLASNDTYELVDLPPGRRAVETKWVFALKRDNKGRIERYKARLVAKGFRQTHGVDFFDTFSPTPALASIRTFLTVAAVKGSVLNQIDFVTAFLNSELKEDVLISQPPGFAVQGNEDKVGRLKKALYGLKQAGRAWYELLRGSLVEIGLNPLDSEPCIFVHAADELALIVIVDDMAIASPTQQVADGLIDSLEARFKIKRIGELKRFVGLEITRSLEERTIRVGQQRYARELLERFHLRDARPLGMPMPIGTNFDQDAPPCNKTLFQELTGSVTHLSIVTRPDIALAVGRIQRHMAAPTVEHLAAAQNILRYISGTLDYTLELGGSLDFSAFVDSAFADDKQTGRSTNGFAIRLGAGAISWSSKRQSLVTLSTTEAEYVAASSAAREIVWVTALLHELGINIGTVPLHCDNQGAIDLGKLVRYRPRTKHIGTRFHYVRECIDAGIIDLQYISTHDQLADALTKPLSGPAIKTFAQRVGLVDGTARGGVLGNEQVPRLAKSGLSALTSDGHPITAPGTIRQPGTRQAQAPVRH